MEILQASPQQLLEPRSSPSASMSFAKHSGSVGWGVALPASRVHGADVCESTDFGVWGRREIGDLRPWVELS